MRIAIGGMMHESNTFVAMPTDMAAFAARHDHGAEIIERWHDSHHEVAGFIQGARAHGFELYPTVMAWATPAGPVDDLVIDEVVGEIIDGCRRASADGLLLALHGAMVSRRHPDADGEVLRRLRVRTLHDGAWIEDQPRHGGRRLNDQGPTAVIELEGPNLLVLNSLRTPPFSLGQLTSLGIDPARQAILVVKAAVAYKAAYGPIAGRVIEVDTPGLTAIDPARFTFRHIRRPMFPLDV